MLLDISQRTQLPCSSTSHVSKATLPSLASLSARKQSDSDNGVSQSTVSRSCDISPTTALQLSLSCLKAAKDLRNACEISLKRALNDPSTKARIAPAELQILEDWNAVHARQIRSWEEDAFVAARKAVSESLPSHGRSLKQKKPIFNYEYTSLLDKYFEYNAYPSAADKAVLAKKSMMTSRQIEVWFQNHRNRAKKEGRTLRRLTDVPSASLEITLKALEREMPFFTTSPHEQKYSSGTSTVGVIENDILPVQSSSSGSSIPDTLDAPRPPHAFPTICSPRIFDETLLNKTYTFSPPVWDRKPNSTFPRPATQNTNIDFNGFITYFSQKLHLRAAASNQTRSKSSKSWCADRFIRPYPAPLPALVRFPVRGSSTRKNSIVTPHELSQHTTPTHREFSSPTKRNISLTHISGDSISLRTSPFAPSTPPLTSCSPSSNSNISKRRLSSSYSSSSSSRSSSPATSISECEIQGVTDPRVLVYGVDLDDQQYENRESIDAVASLTSLNFPRTQHC